MRGRKPRPTTLKLLDGTRADRINHDEPGMPPASMQRLACLEIQSVGLKPDKVSAGAAAPFRAESAPRECTRSASREHKIIE